VSHVREDVPSTPKRRVLIAALTLAVLLGAVTVLGAMIITRTTYLNPGLVAERLIDCIGADGVVATLPVSRTPPNVRVAEVIEGFQSPMAVLATPTEQLLVVERRGVISSQDLKSGMRTVILDLSSTIDSSVEGGLLGAALHPAFGTGGESRIFIVFTRLSDRALVVGQMELGTDLVADAGSLRVMQMIPRENGWHAAGGAAFLPDGRLLVGVGDDFKPNESQSGASLLGKILAFDVNDPAVGGAIYASGLRNPLRFTVDPESGTLWVADVGQFCIEEINRVPLADAEGSNFGWPLFEGSRRWPRYVSSDFGYGDGASEQDTPNSVVFVEPVTTYLHKKGGACAVIGGAVVEGWYLFADYCDGIVRGIPTDAEAGTQAVALLKLNKEGLKVGVIGVMKDSQQRTWVLDGWGGSLIRLEISPSP
jgi:glucose/arabinose dehydrogenase